MPGLHDLFCGRAGAPPRVEATAMMTHDNIYEA
jgi:hypothetical protein